MLQGLLFDCAVKQPMHGKDDEVPVPRNNSSASAGRPSADRTGILNSSKHKEKVQEARSTAGETVTSIVTG